MKINVNGISNCLIFLSGQIRLLICCTAFLMITANSLFAQVGDVLWEENFNSLNTDYWTPNVGDGCDIGLCGWGNAELEYYSPNNVTIEQVPGEPGNNALVLEAKNESAGSQSFTSGKVDTDGKVSIHYGLIEVRMRVPNLETGLWPAAWLLGDVNLPWPAKGEIDMMEMGHAYEERERQGHPGASENDYVGANAIWQSADGGYASIAWDVNYNQPYVAPQALNDRFVIYRLYWEPTSMRFTVIDNGVEYDMYTNPLPIDAEGETAAFTKPFYMLLNLAVGGNFTDAAVPSQVTAPLPGKMYVDYVRVSQYNGHGSVEFSDGSIPSESGTFGIYTEITPTNNALDFANDGAIYAWGGTVQDGTTPAYEGTEVIAWETTNPNSWFGGGIVSLYGKNMSNFVENGSLRFKIKIPGDVSFRIGVTDNFTNESYVNFPAGQTTYGLTRDGEWGQVEIPIADLAGIIAFQDMNYLFAIVSDDANIPSSTFQFAIDDIVWDDGNGDVVPVLTSITVDPSSVTIDEGSTQQFNAQAFDQNGNPMSATFSWNSSAGTISNSGLYTGTTTGNHTITASSGNVSGTANVAVNSISTGIVLPGIIQAEDYNEGGNGIGYYDLSSGNTGGEFRNDDVDIENTGDVGGGYNVGWISATEWLAFDINAQANTNLYDIEFRVASPSGSGSFHVEIDGVDVTGPISVVNTGSWQNYSTVSVNNISIDPGSHELRVVFDAAGFNLNYLDISESQTQILTSLIISPSSVSIDQGATQQFTAQGYDQNGNPMTVTINWSASVGTINSSGLYTATDEGNYIVTASNGSISGTSNVSVNTIATGWSIPGRIEAENFNGGGQGAGYFDTSTGNTGGAFRLSEDVDIQNTSDSNGGLYNVGWIAAGEWLEYDINTTGGNYDFQVRVASPNGNGRLHLEIDGVDVSGTLVVPNTGGWQNYTTITAENISISSGNHVLRVAFDASGLNLNYLEAISSNVSSNCSGGPENGDYTYTISDGNNPEITFEPGYTGVGDAITILYYGTSPSGPYPGYLVSPNNPHTLSGVNSGQTVYFYYTYSVPEGGERNTAANPHQFTIDNCGSNARFENESITEKLMANDVTIYPVPAGNNLRASISDYDELIIVDMTGRVYQDINIKQKGDHIIIDTSWLTRGSYLLKVTVDGYVLIKQFVKN
ncbi:MAG: DUF5010 C-terminal domain-containing protein [bacterium]|nr:DUF5010 C-terminal domain-containing protein [bacterium]